MSFHIKNNKEWSFNIEYKIYVVRMSVIKIIYALHSIQLRTLNIVLHVRSSQTNIHFNKSSMRAFEIFLKECNVHHFNAVRSP